MRRADELIAATRKAREAGYTRMDGYSPYPLGEVADELGFPRSEIGAIMFIGGLCGASLGFLMQTWITTYDYPLSVGGKPFWSWPQYIPVTWALLVLTASMSGLFGLLALCGLPQPYHPVFNVPQLPPAQIQAECWTMYFYGSLMKTRAGAGLLFVSPLGVHVRYVIRLHFAASNNVAEYEALVNGLRVAIELGVRCLDVRGDSQLVIDQVMESSCHDPKMEAYCKEVRCLKDKFDGLELNHIA